MVTSKHLRRYISIERVKTRPVQTLNSSTAEPDDENFPNYAQHRPHELYGILEVSNSSRSTILGNRPSSRIHGVDGSAEYHKDVARPPSSFAISTKESSDSAELAGKCIAEAVVRPSDLRSLAASTLSLPLRQIPRRRSSVSALSQSLPVSHHGSLLDLRSRFPHSQQFVTQTCLPGHTTSPVRHVLAKGAQSSEALRTSPSRTFVRTTTPYYLLDDDKTRNSRLDLSIRLPSSLFVGGGTVEGQIELKIDATSSKKMRSVPLLLSRLSVDIIGVEEVEDGRQHVFLNLATELFDSRHPPPSSLVTSQKPEKGSELYWQAKPGTAMVPFCVHLPLKLGPPPYSSRQASIRYLLCPSAVAKVGEKRSTVHQAWTVQIFTVHDPERALASLPSPLLATDTLMLSHTPVVNSVKLTTGLHRQTWVSGGVVFIDIHIVNSTEKTLKHIELQLEKSILWFSHSAASTAESRRNNLRLPAKVETEIVKTVAIKKSKSWHGVAPQAAEVRTCELEIPKGHVTIGNGRHFEVRYFVKVTVTAKRSKSVSVQLPITIIHINSLDIMPNSLAQVAASIEAKRLMATNKERTNGSHQPHTQGQAFVAVHRQPFREAIRTSDGNTDGIPSLTHIIDSSPRRATDQDNSQTCQDKCVNMNSNKKDRPQAVPSCQRHLASHPSCYHCHLLHAEHASKSPLHAGPKLPRLQVSTSGLGFSESEFDLPPDTPRKVMLSERERQMINQERELRSQRQLSQQKARSAVSGRSSSQTRPGFMAWKNVAVPFDARSNSSRELQARLVRNLSQRQNTGTRAHRSSLPPRLPGRTRSKTNPEQLRASFSDSGPIQISRGATDQQERGMRSLDHGNRGGRPGYNVSEDDVFGPNKRFSDHSQRKKLVPAQSRKT